MTNTLEMKLSIIPFADAVVKYFEHYPNDSLTKISLSHKGPFYSYSFRGCDGGSRHLLKLNAQSGTLIKNKTKALKVKRRAKLEVKKLNLDGIISLSQADDVASKAVPGATPVKWKLEHKKGRAVWKVKLLNATGSDLHKVKLSAKDGSLIQLRVKN